jgi:RNA polymerase sigma-70 factor (ECF subfamily)
VSIVCVTDADLVARAREGDPAAFGELVDRHRVAVYRAALAALGSHPEAEDAAQEALLSAFRRLDSFRGDASFKTWLLTIAWHEAINTRRGLKRMWRHLVEPRRGDYDDQGDSLESIPNGASTPEQQAAYQGLSRAIRRIIRGLPPKLRDTLLLAQSGDYSYDEISAMLGAPLGTIKWRVSEARRLVRSSLREEGFGDVAVRR